MALGDHVEHLRMKGTAFRADGNELDNQLTGDALDNWLWGDDGDDRLQGRDGDDWLTDGFGRDLLWGGRGADRFSFVQDGERDVIKDFELGVEVVSLTGWGVAWMNELEITTWSTGKVLIEAAGDSILVQDAARSRVAQDFTDRQFEFAETPW